MTTIRDLLLFPLVVSMTLGTVVPQDAAAEQPAVSSYAPLTDLVAQLKYYIDRMSADLSDEDGFGEDQVGRLEKNASTVAVLALMLGMHDQENPPKKSASHVIELSLQLAEQAGDFEEAKETLALLKAAIEEGDEGEELEWEPVGDLMLLMQQVPVVNNTLRRGVTSRRFMRSIDQTAGHAVTLAAIGQVSMLNLDYCGDEEEEKEWQQLCVDMRDAAAEVYRAVRKKDQKAAKVSMEKIVTSCDDCHEKFR